jgi:hypothetical protein
MEVISYILLLYISLLGEAETGREQSMGIGEIDGFI